MRYPGASWKPCTNYSKGTIGKMSVHLGLVLHVQQGNGGLQDFFSRPNGQSSSHFWVSRLGAVEQYVDTEQRAWAQAAGNDSYLSVETEGWTTEPLTPAQVRSLAALYAWCSTTYALPIRVSDRPGQMGLGWHGMGGVAWGNHPGCPGELRKAQRQEILSLIHAEPKEDWDVMATKEEIKQAVREVLAEKVIQSDEPNETTMSRDQATYRTYSNGRKAIGKVPDQP